jgi:sulfatase modifying factor 1
MEYPGWMARTTLPLLRSGAVAVQGGPLGVVATVAAVMVGGCHVRGGPVSGGPGGPSASPPSAAPVAASASVAGLESRSSASLPSAAPAAAGATPPPPACPDGMIHVAHSFCPELQRRCLDSEYEPSNHITLCHRFAIGEQRCLGPRQALDFCIDRYEYPNRLGAHPPVMIDWHDAERLCAASGKRLCSDEEWTAACEGPDELPFPYGWDRDPAQCNIDNPWISPSLGKLQSPRAETRDAELARLDRGVPSGSRPGCVSGYGVFDLTGNFDEWVRASASDVARRGHAAALKGGAWGHVRNACRPVTTSHAPGFAYYFVSTRCCRDPARDGDSAPSGEVAAPG